jgi:hypothetical protein
MDRDYWYTLFRDVRAGVPGLPNLFPPDERAAIALEMALSERKAKRKEDRDKRNSH